MRVAIVVAVSRNGVIGRDGGLPWKLASDLRRFRKLTTGRPVVMGRRTHESIGRPLPGRTNIVITRNGRDPPPGVRIARDLASALVLARSAAGGADEAFVIGGARVYREALAVADVVHMTEVHAEVAGGVTFPLPLGDGWREVSRERHAAGEGDDHAHSFVTHERVRPSARP